MSIIAPIILLGILIFVHELGHFIFAKLMGVKVLKFSLGFGRKLIGGKIGETEYQVAMLPIGGYVKMFGEESGEEMHITGEGDEAPMPASEEDLKRAFSAQPVWKRIVIVLSGPMFNILLTFVIFAGFLGVGLPVVVPTLDDIAPEVGEVIANTPAAMAGIQADDVFTEVDGKPIDSWFGLVDKISKKPGEHVSLKVKRGDKTIALDIVPEKTEVKDSKGDTVTIGRIGVVKKVLKPPFVVEANGLMESINGAAAATWKLSVSVLDILKGLVTGKVSFRTMGGPVTIVHESSKAVSLGISYYLFFMAFISTNLGVINLFPIPILDGGHIVFLAYEGIARKPANEKLVETAQKVGLVLLLMLIVLVTYNDIFRLFS